MNIDSALDYRRKAPQFIAEFKDRECTLAAQLHCFNMSTDEDEKNMLTHWLDVNKKWLDANREKYNKCVLITNLPLHEMEAIAKEIQELQNG